MNGLNLHVPNIDLIKTSGEEEFGAGPTQAETLDHVGGVGGLAAVDRPPARLLPVAHEVFHVLSRTDPLLRDDLYALLGFRTVDGFEYPVELEDRRVSNPDCVRVPAHSDRSIRVGERRRHAGDSIAVAVERGHSAPEFLRRAGHRSLSVDAGTGEALRDGNGDLIKYNFGNTNWIPLMLRNSSFIIQPEEILADNFATLMEWRAYGVLPPANPGGFPVNDVDLLTAIEGVLASGCRER